MRNVSADDLMTQIKAGLKAIEGKIRGEERYEISSKELEKFGGTDPKPEFVEVIFGEQRLPR